MSISFLKLLFLILAIFLSIKYILFWTYIWQLKEYRWDRFRDFLKSSEGRRAFFNIFYLVKLLFIILIISSWALFFIYEQGIFLIIYPFFIFSILSLLFFETVLFLKRILTKTVAIPVFTKKALLIVLFLELFHFYLFFRIWLIIDGRFIALPLLLILICAPFFTALANLLLYPFSYILKNQRIKKASQLMKNFGETAIGITGSYGKSSVKEYCASLLSQKFDIIKTPKNINTEIGVANYIERELSQLNKGLTPLCLRRQTLPPSRGVSNPNKYFICEMGAYRIGEIKKLCDMVKPNIGILTGINEQHLALFGSIENTIKAKSELIHSLPSNGLAIINWDDENCRKVIIPKKVRKITYGFSGDADVQATEIKKFRNIEIREWKLKISEETIDITSKLIWKHEIQNILPAIAVAYESGMSIDEIKKAVEKSEPPENGMKIKKIAKALLIGDTYNSNPTGVKSALEVLDSIDKKYTILVLDDIWELGKESKRIHRELAKIISSKNYDKIILVGKNYADFMKKELIKKGVNKEIIENMPESLKKYLQLDSVILFEGRMAKKYLVSCILY